MFLGEYGSGLLAQKVAVGEDMTDGGAQIVRRHADKLRLESAEAFEFEILLSKVALRVGKLIVEASQLVI